MSRGRVEHDLYSWTTWESQLGAFIEKGGESFQKGRRMDTCSTLGGVQAVMLERASGSSALQ